MTDFRSKDDVFAYLIRLGYLAYDKDDSTCYIHNYEVRYEWISYDTETKEHRTIIEVA